MAIRMVQKGRKHLWAAKGWGHSEGREWRWDGSGWLSDFIYFSALGV